MISHKTTLGHGPLANDLALRNQLQQSSIFDAVMGNDKPHITGVCSCHSGAGTSSVALGLAIMIQERSGEPVLLIEANCRTPVLKKAFELSPKKGFEAFAKQEADANECIVELPATGVSAIVAEALATPLPLMKAAKEQLSQFESAFKHIIVDFPPVLPYPDTGIMAAATDGVLLVLKAEETRWQVAKETKSKLESADVNLLGAVLNKKPHYIPSWLYRLL